MKNYAFILIIALLVMPFAFADDYTDFSRPYIQNRLYSGTSNGNSYTFDSYLLRSNHNDTKLDFEDPSWGSCSVSTAGSKYGGVPFSFYDYSSAYERHVFIVLEEGSIKEYYANCSIYAEYVFSGNAVSQIAIINKGYVTPSKWYPPYVAFAYNKTEDSNVYLMIMEVDITTGYLIFLQEVLIGTDDDWGQYDENQGVAGGAIVSSTNTPIGYMRTFGLMHDTDLFIAQGWGGGADVDFNETQIIAREDRLSVANDHMLYFDDIDRDGFNEYIAYGIYPSSSDAIGLEFIAVQPLTTPPYYYSFPRQALNLTLSQFVSGFNTTVLEDGSILPCQIGDKASGLETCFDLSFYVNSANDGYWYLFSDYVSSDWIGFGLTLSTQGAYTDDFHGFTKSFTYIKESTQEYIYCNSHLGYYVILCYDINDYEVNDFNPDKTLALSTHVREVLIADIVGNTTPEIIFTDGTAESIHWGGNSDTTIEWQDGFTDANNGRLFSQDISGDNVPELIYFDNYDTGYLKIYSMYNTPAEMLIPENYITITTTTTTNGGTTTTTLTTEQQTDQFKVNVKLIIAMGLILAIMGFMAYLTRSTIVTIFGGIIGLVLSVAFELISSGVLVILLISLVILLVLGLFIMKRGD